MRFEFFPLRFEFTALDSIFFPPGKAANILRGALGVIFRSLACRPDCTGAGTCANRQICPYARVFEPVAAGSGPSGLADWPRPFVFRARHLDGRTIRAGEAFSFDLNLFSLDRDVLPYFVLTFAALAKEGLGPRRGRAELIRAVRIQMGEIPQPLLSEKEVEPAFVDLAPRAVAPNHIRVHFLSPTELKHDHRLAERPEFPILFDRIRDRVSTLRSLYGPGPLDIDFQGISARAAGVRMTRCEVMHVESERRSSRTGQTHSLGGFIGIAEYEGPFAEFLPYLEAARWTGVGRQSVWGKGEIDFSLDPGR